MNWVWKLSFVCLLLFSVEEREVGGVRFLIFLHAMRVEKVLMRWSYVVVLA
jgi:hypothetical protein